MKRIIFALFAALLLTLAGCDKITQSRTSLYTTEDLVGHRFICDHGVYVEALIFYDMESPDGLPYMGYLQYVPGNNTACCYYGSWSLTDDNTLAINNNSAVTEAYLYEGQGIKYPLRMLVRRRSEPEMDMFYCDYSYDPEADILWNPKYVIARGGKIELDIIPEEQNEIQY